MCLSWKRGWGRRRRKHEFIYLFISVCEGMDSVAWEKDIDVRFSSSKNGCEAFVSLYRVSQD